MNSRVFENVMLTSRAETNCKGLKAVFMSGMFDSRSYSALAILDSSSEGRWRDELVGAILLRAAAMIAVVEEKDDRWEYVKSLDGDPGEASTFVWE